MKKHIVLHLLYTASFFLLISVLREWFGLVFVEFWIGGLIGALLPDIDRFLYVYIFNPDSPISKQVASIGEQKGTTQAMSAVSSSEIDDKDLILHSARFQLIFLLFTFWVVSSSNSLFGWGLVLAATLHLLVDQAAHYISSPDMTVWFRDVPFEIEADQRKLFFWVSLIILLFLGLIY